MNFSSKSIFSVTLEEIPEGWDRSGGPSAPYKNYRKFREVGGGGEVLREIPSGGGGGGGGDVLREILSVVGIWSFSVSSTQ